MLRISAPGKLILFGEHAVVYNQLGIASAIDLHAKLTAEEAGETTIKDGEVSFKVDRDELSEIKLEVDGLIAENNHTVLRELSRDQGFCLKHTLSRCISHKDYKIVIDCKIPEAAGLGSGSAVFACLGAIYKNDLADIQRVSNLGDVVAHGGIPSGIDSSVVVYGNYLSFKKSEGMKRLKIDAEPFIVIGHSGVKTSTAKTVGHVRENIERFMQHIEKIGEISRKGLIALQEKNLSLLGKLMNENQALLEKMELSHPKLEELIGIARANGALGAKLSGKGGGGVAIALCRSQHDQTKIKKEFESAGFKAYSAKLGVGGIKKQ